MGCTWTLLEWLCSMSRGKEAEWSLYRYKWVYIPFVLWWQSVDSWNPKLAGFLNPKPMIVTVYMTVDQWSDTMPYNYGFHTFPNLLKNLLERGKWLCLYTNALPVTSHGISVRSLEREGPNNLPGNTRDVCVLRIFASCWSWVSSPGILTHLLPTGDPSLQWQ